MSEEKGILEFQDWTVGLATAGRVLGECECVCSPVEVGCSRQSGAEVQLGVGGSYPWRSADCQVEGKPGDRVGSVLWEEHRQGACQVVGCLSCLLPVDAWSEGHQTASLPLGDEGDSQEVSYGCLCCRDCQGQQAVGSQGS